MSLDEVNQMKADLKRVELTVYNLSAQLEQTQNPTLSSPDTSFHPVPITAAPSAVNQAPNGEYSHSGDTWNNPPPGAPASDAGKECYNWFTNLAPFVGQVLSFTTSPASANNQTLKAYIDDGGVHPFYNPAYCDWDRSTGEVRLTGTTTLDGLFPSNRIVVPNRATDYFGALVARRNSTIVIRTTTHLYAGLWDTTAGTDRPDWIRGTPFKITSSTVRGTPSGTTERRYRVYAFTDRGYTYLSEETTVLDAPSDAGYSTADVYLVWRPIPGILNYSVYRFDVVAGEYHLLRDSLISNSYADNGSFLDKTISGYPAATNTTPIAYVATRDADLLNIPADGNPWVTLFLNIPIPSDYDVAQTTGQQVLRVGMTEPMDRLLTDVVCNSGIATITSDSGNFTTLDNGRSVTLTEEPNSLTTTIDHIVDANTAVLAVAPSFSSIDASLYIVEGGDHGLLLDAAHISYVPNSAFAAYPDDLNRLQNGGQNPIAAPNHSSQGGAGGPTGGGGGIDPGDGGIGCIPMDCPVIISVGHALEALAFKSVAIGEALFSGNLRANRVTRKHLTDTDNLMIIRVRWNWLYNVELPCSPGQPIICDQIDLRGRKADTLKAGNSILVSFDGTIRRKPIIEIIETGQACRVGTFTLGPGDIFWAGSARPTWLGRFLAWWKRPLAGIALHNRKPISESGPVS